MIAKTLIKGAVGIKAEKVREGVTVFENSCHPLKKYLGGGGQLFPKTVTPPGS